MKKDFVEANKIKNIYSYKEIYKENNIVEFGWQIADFLGDGQIVISYPSRTKKVTSDEKKWSSGEGVNAATLSDYSKYFESLTGLEPHVFYDEHFDNKEIFCERWTVEHEEHDYEMAEFILNLCNLIVNEKKFIMYGRGFKLSEKILEKT